MTTREAVAFLNAAELADLTGRKQSKRQAEWLRSRRIKHYVNAQNRVIVDRTWLGSGEQAPEPVQPDFSGIT
jgi:tRNA A37 N6-isopentenylltransferase MiaA